MERIHRKRWYINRQMFFLLCICVLAACTACGRQNKEDALEGKTIVNLGYLPITHSLAVFETKELLEQKDSDVQIKLTKFSTWPDLMDALNSGKIDGAAALIELAMTAKSRGIDLKIVALGHKAGNAIVVSNKIKSVKDLKGKKFAIPSTQSSHNILLREMLAKEGMTVDDIEIIQLAPTEMPFSLASGAIDGFCVAEPFGAQVVSKKLGHVLYDSEELWEHSICCGFVLHENFLTKNKEMAEELIDTYKEAGEQLDFDTCMKVSNTYLGQETSTLEQSLKWIQFDDLTLKKEEYDFLSEKVRDYGIIENPPTYEEIIK